MFGRKDDSRSRNSTRFTGEVPRYSGETMMERSCISLGEMSNPFACMILPDGHDNSDGRVIKQLVPESKVLPLPSADAYVGDSADGGTRMIRTLQAAFNIPNDKLIYLQVHGTRDVVDVDSIMEPERDYDVRVEPEDQGPWNIVPCLTTLFTFQYAGNRRALT